jgi:putative acetyltransferase
MKNVEIRRAVPEDAFAIHQAHMTSIREICSKDHSPEEVSVWGNRPYNEEQRHRSITKQFVYIVLVDNRVEGFIHFDFTDSAKNEIYIFALYLTLNAAGFGVGRKFIDIVFLECKKSCVKSVNLHSTITAHNFYQKMGFIDTAAMTTVEVAGQPVRCIPMGKNI